MATRTVGSLFLVVLLTSALFVSIFSVATPPKEAHATALTVTFYSGDTTVITSGKYGDLILVKAGTDPALVDWSTCTISAPVSNIVTQTAGMQLTVFSGVAYGAFRVGSGPGAPGGIPYTITVTCGSDSGTAPFTVNPSITLSPYIAYVAFFPTGTFSVSVSGTGFASDATTCTISGTGGIVVSQSCHVSGGSLSSSSFIANAAAPVGGYQITVTPDKGSSASTDPAGFLVVTIPTISLASSYGAGPLSAPPGYGPVRLTGGGFASTGTARGCSFTVGATLVLADITSTTCTIDKIGTLTASFTVAPTATVGDSGIISINDATTPGGPFAVGPGAFAVFTPATIGPPAPAAAGKTVTVPLTANAFGDGGKADAGPCTLSSNPNGLFTSSFCLVDNIGNLWAGPGLIQAMFKVSGTVPGQNYVLTITGLNGDPSGTTNFVVDQAITVTPTAGSPPVGSLLGTPVTISGTGFYPTTNGCTIKSTPAGLISSPSCAVTVGTGALTATFVVAPLATNATYTLTATGTVNGVPGADSANGPFHVEPRIVVVPTVGAVGQTIAVLGSGFQAGGAVCTSWTALQGGVVVPLFSSSTCALTADGIVTVSFTVAPALANGVYTIRVVGRGPDVPFSDIATAPFTKGVPVTLTISPLSGSTTIGAVTVTAPAGSFGTADRGLPCSITVTPSGSNLFVGAPTCAIDSSGALSTSFTVASTAQGGTWTVQVTGGGGGVGTGTFTVTPKMTLTPSSGSSSTSVSIAGSGFSAADAAAGCASLSSSPTGLLSGLSCSISAFTFQMTGSFTVASAASPGSYTVTYPSSLGTVTATPTFVKTGGLSLTPITGGAGTSVLVSGSLASGDTSCAITSSPSSPTLISNPVCTVTGGVASGSFTVAPGASGAYLVTITGSTGDVAIASFSAPLLPSLTLTPISGPAGTVVTASASNLAGTSCTLTSSPAGLFTSTSQSCTISAGALSSSGFTVATSASPGTVYTVTVTTNVPSDTSTATFTVPVVLPPTFYLTPSSGLPGAVIAVSGQNYLGTICSLSSAPSGLFSSTPTCSISGGTLTGSFTVASNAPFGSYTVTVTTNISTDTNTAPFTVSASTFTLSPTSGGAGTIVSALGKNYAGTTCSLSSAPSGLFSSTPACSISGGMLTGSFTVASNAPLGSYVVTVTTNVAGETNAAPFAVTAAGAPTFVLSSSSGPAGTVVSASGQNYAGATCSLSFTPSTPSLFTSQSCSISAGTLSGDFIVAPGASGTVYTVTATTNVGETKSAPFTVSGPLTFILTPASGIVGTVVTATGSNFVGTTCTLSVTPSNLFTSQTCSISSGTLSGGFTVASGASPGTVYTVTVTTNVAGETRAASFTISSPAVPTFVLSPSSGAWGTGVSISGTNYAGITCTLTSSPSGLFTSSTCSIYAGALSGGFTVATGAPAGGYTVTITTNKEQLSVPFTVTTKTSPCIIATATFGSEAAPAVQYLRDFRDHLALSTRAGSAFMVVFNAWYYSFSPTVAGYIAANDPLRAPIRVILYPLLGVLGVSTFTYSLFSGAPEFAIVMAGLVASSLIGLVYLTPFTLVGMRSLKRRKRINTINITKAALLVLATGLGLLAAGELAGSFLLLAIASSAIVLTCIIAAPTILALVVMTRPKSQ